MIQIALQKKLSAATGEMLLDINMQIEQGKLVTLYGSSGAGKTSILRMIAGLLQADTGTITVHQKTWLNTSTGICLKPQQRKIGFVFQDYALFPNMTVKENLLFALEKNQDKQIVKELIEIIELEDLQNRKPNNLSGGQKQRVALARALVRKPEILMLDEPLSALDKKMRIKLQDYILKVHKKFNITTLLISHDISEVIKMSDTVFMIENGKIIQQGNPIEVFTTKKVSGKFQFTGEVIDIKKEDVIYIVTVLIGTNFVKIIAEENEIQTITIGDPVLVASKAFNPLLQKIN
ncbi:ABC transporter ATP-binding protein [Aquimarina muelleri]|uniref:GTPase n=1 Tax=Aquimarina muelleri TaxID=279356 RepID=A0A918JUS7_9FLAO|nr:ATP-binding cassette domain-containing protein [Aquimarina muelleri]MCX2764043.1 ATP-binding cassette domain-containing protein [Aquimarina muelleri]GGX11966.1 GTPase [Aquimarina muelleri]